MSAQSLVLERNRPRLDECTIQFQNLQRANLVLVDFAPLRY